MTACRTCSRSLLLTAEQAAGVCLLCNPVLVAAHKRREVQAEPAQPRDDGPEAARVDDRADTVPAAPPDPPTVEP